MSIRNICLGISLTLSGIFISGAVNAQGQHPYCLQALSDLRAARWLLQQHVGGKAMTHNEKEALRQINVMIREMNDAAIDDGKTDDHSKAREGQDDAANVRQCIELLQKAQDDLHHEDDSQFANGLRNRSIKNCEETIKFVSQEQSRLNLNKS
jgi:hypothetical protein